MIARNRRVHFDRGQTQVRFGALGGLQAFLLVAFLLHFEAAVLPFFEFWSHFSVSLFLLVAVDLTQRTFDPLAKQRGVV